MMSSRQVDLHPEAVAEAQAAAQWYRERSVSAAHAFLTELDRAIEKIAEDPGIWPRIGACLSARHSFALVYHWHERSSELAGSSRLRARGCRRSGNGSDPDSESQS